MDTNRLPAALQDLAAEQCDVVRRSQLVEHQVPENVVRAQLAARRWQTVGPTVVVLHNGPLTDEQRTWVALLTAPGTAAVAGRHAAALAGLRRWAGPITPEIVVPRGDHVPTLPFPVKVHESRRFSAEDVHPALRPARVTLERAVIDAATWTKSPRSACGLLAAAVQQRLTTADRLQAELAKAGLIRHRGLLRAVLVDIDGGAQSLDEAEFGAFLRAHGLPTPRRQVIRTDGSGRRRYLDVELVGPDGKVVHVELDGALHLVVTSYWEDMHRGNELLLTGARVMRYPSISWRLEPARVADQLHRVLGLGVQARAA